MNGIYVYLGWIGMRVVMVMVMVMIGWLCYRFGVMYGSHKEKMNLYRAIDSLSVGSDVKILLLMSFEAEIEAERYYSGKPIA